MRAAHARAVPSAHHATTTTPFLPSARHLSPTRPRVQAKLTVGPVDDPLEREADRVAEAVVSGRAAPGTVQRKCAECEEEEQRALRKEVGPGPVGSSSPSSMAGGTPSSAAGPATAAVPSLGHGSPLPADVRATLEPRFGRSFADVRVHTDASAAASTTALDARAYTLGRDIAFAPGEYRPYDRDGQRLLAHELAHVVQQGAGAPVMVRRQERNVSSGAPDLSTEEALALYRWLSHWRIEPPGDRLLKSEALGEDHERNLDLLTVAILERRTEAGERVDPRLLMHRAGEPWPPTEAALRDGPIRRRYDQYIHRSQQRLEPGEQSAIEIAVATMSVQHAGERVRLTGDEDRDTLLLAQAVLCSRLSLILDEAVDPLLCVDPQVTRASPIIAAFRATTVAPFYRELRRRPGRAVLSAMEEGRLTAGEHAWQIRQIAATGAVRAGGQTIVPSIGLLRLLESLAAGASPPARGRPPNFAIVSLVRPSSGPHGTPIGEQVQVGRAVDIVRYAGKRIDIAFPTEAAEAIAAVIRNMAAGCYVLGLPRPPRTDPEGGSIDLQRHPRLYSASTVAPSRPRLSPLGERVIRENPFLPAENIGNCPTGTIEGDLARLAPDGRAALEPAIRDAREQRGVQIRCLFPDAPDHLHIQVEPCPGEPALPRAAAAGRTPR